MNYKELKEIFCNLKQKSPTSNLTAHITFTEDSFKDYLKKELEAGGIKPSGMYGGDVPDGLCYQWAEDYFRDPDADEDKEKEEFKPRTYVSHKPAAPKPAPKPKSFMDGQISLLGAAS